MNHNLYHRFATHFPNDLSTPVIRQTGSIVADYEQLENRSAQFANQLVSLGAGPGDRVTVQVEKSINALWLYLGCLRAGLVFHPLNTAYQENELSYFLGNAEPSIVIGDNKTTPTLKRLANAGVVVTTIDELAADAAHAPETFNTVSSEPNDLAALLYSSGTTGVPKGIMLSHANLLANTGTLVESWGFTSADVLLHALPVFHVHGLFVATGCALMSGAQMVWLNQFRVDDVLDAMPTCTVMMGVPTFYTRLLGTTDFNENHCHNMRLFISGSAPLLPETFADFEARTGHRILERYGMTETGMNTSNPLDGERIAGTVGLPLSDVLVRVVDDQQESLPANTVGAVQVKGPNVFQGYWKLPDKTAEDFTPDGFFNTGDQGLIDENGYLSIIGREKDMIISGGLNIYPREIELLLDEQPGVSESAVFGVAHADFGEGVVAAIVETEAGSLEENDIIQTVKAGLAAFKVPKAVVFLTELPRNTMGKVQKKQLRDTYKNLLS